MKGRTPPTRPLPPFFVAWANSATSTAGTS
jgi:hypothetical protein